MREYNGFTTLKQSRGFWCTLENREKFSEIDTADCGFDESLAEVEKLYESRVLANFNVNAKFLELTIQGSKSFNSRFNSVECLKKKRRKRRSRSDILVPIQIQAPSTAQD